MALVLEGIDGTAPPPIAGRYRVQARIAHGGTGPIYRVVDEASGQRRALKRSIGDPPGARRRTRAFEREFYTLAALEHPRILEVFDFGVDEQGAYYTMELLEGRDLHELAPLPYTVACRLLRDVASSLALLHARNLLHRDLSPRNVRITGDERAKLLDFSALASFGRSAVVAGTPALVPPEALDGSELDQRADLYSLGALGYFLLTGRHAFEVQAIAELRDAHACPPLPPSAVAPRDRLPPIPGPLDDLVLGLLDRDPLARPSSAVQVIAQLSAIAHLPADREPLPAASHLHGGRTVGRTRERGQLRRRMKAALAGSGSVALVHAEPGMGSTRMLSELAVEARQLGACAVVIDAARHRAAYGVAREIAQAVLAARPDEARAALGEHEQTLARFFENGEASGPGAPPSQPAAAIDEQDPRESRLRIQSALLEWLARFAQRTPLLIAVRATQHCDESSATLLCALGPILPERQLLLVLASDPDEPAAAPAAHAALREIATPVHLRGLSRDDVRSLIEGALGEVPGTERLAAWLHEHSSGKPQACLDLLQHLIEQGVIRSCDGVWALPNELAPEELPRDYGQVLGQRLSRLSEPARALALAVSLHRGPMPIERALALCEQRGFAEPLGLIAELEQRGVLVSGDRDLRFVHTGLHEAAREELDPRAAREVHALLGALIARERGTDARAVLDAGWHLCSGGEERRGAELLARAGLVLAQDADALAVATPALEAALAAYRAQRRSRGEQAALLGRLVLAGSCRDRRLMQRYGEDAAAALETVLGLPLARTLRPILGGRLGLAVGFARAWLGFALGKGPRRALSALREHLQLFASTVLALAGLSAITLDAPAARRHARRLALFKFLGEDHALAVSYRHAAALAMLPEDRIAQTLAGAARVLERLCGERPLRDLSAAARLRLSGSALHACGLLEAFRGDPEALRIAERLDASGSKLLAIRAAQIRATYHGLAGEEDAAQRHREQVELLALQAGSSWQVEIWTPVSALLCYLVTGDLAGLQRVARQLERLADEIPSLRRHAQLAVAVQLFACGQLEQSHAQALALINSVEPRAFVGWAPTVAALIEGMCARGEVEQARQLGERALALYDADDRTVSTMIAPLVGALALAEGRLGMTGVAAARIDDFLVELGERGGAATRGGLHEARARIAAMAGDTQAAELHLALAKRYFLPTFNPALVARGERLRREIQGGSGERVRTSSPPLAPGRTANE